MPLTRSLPIIYYRHHLKTLEQTELEETIVPVLHTPQVTEDALLGVVEDSWVYAGPQKRHQLPRAAAVV